MNTVPASSLAAWLLERLAEDEAAAKAAAEAPWTFIAGVDASLVQVDPAAIREEKWRYGHLGHVATTSHDAGYAEHIARHDPARVLADVEAKREVVEILEFIRWAGEHWAVMEAEKALRALAKPYAGAEGWQEEWA